MKAYFESLRDTDNYFHIEAKTNDNCPPHFHSNIEILYVTDGEMDVAINRSRARLNAGMVAVSNSFDVHEYTTPSRSGSVFLIIPVKMAEEYQRLTSEKNFVLPFFSLAEHKDEFDFAIRALQRFDHSDNSLLMSGYINVIFGIIIDTLIFDNSKASFKSDEIIRNILIFLDMHFREPITVKLLSEKFGYNRSYISRLFNDQIQISFNSYINRLRVRDAANLIRTTDYPISQIAEISGFSCVRSFNRAFRELYDITPMEYKKHKSFRNTEGNKIDGMFGVYSYLPAGGNTK